MLSKRFQIGTLWGIPFNVSLFWLVAFLLFTVSFTSVEVVDRYVTLVEPLTITPIETPIVEGTLSRVLFGMLLVLTVYTSVILHELGHIYGAQKNNVGVDGLTLWILGGAANIASQPEDPRAEFELTIAGPIVSFILGVTALTLAYLTTPLGINALSAYLFLTALLNLFMLLLNLVPAFPLDGGRLLRAGLAKKYGYVHGTMKATRVAKVFAVLLVGVSIFSMSFMGVVLAGFVFVTAKAEQKRVNGELQELSRLDPDHISLNQEFIFETEIPGFTFSEAASLIEQHDGSVALHTTPETEYVVAPLEEKDMYNAIADKYNATVVSAKTVSERLSKASHTPMSHSWNHRENPLNETQQPFNRENQQ